jgi:hypothetical protein
MTLWTRAKMRHTAPGESSRARWPQAVTTRRGRLGEVLRKPSMSLLKVVVAAALLLASGPSLSAHWVSVTHFDKIGDQGGGELGYVTVARCTRGSLIRDWSCSGTFQVNDGMAEPYQPTPDVRVANDFRWHRPGTTIGATISPGSHVGYRWGTTVQLQTLEYWAGALLCLALLVVSATVAARRRRSMAVAWLMLATWIILAGGFLLIGASASL